MLCSFEENIGPSLSDEVCIFPLLVFLSIPSPPFEKRLVQNIGAHSTIVVVAPTSLTSLPPRGRARYGDISPSTPLSRLLIAGLIISLFFCAPLVTNVLVNLIRVTPKHSGRLAKGFGTGHIVVRHHTAFVFDDVSKKLRKLQKLQKHEIEKRIFGVVPL